MRRRCVVDATSILLRARLAQSGEQYRFVSLRLNAKNDSLQCRHVRGSFAPMLLRATIEFLQQASMLAQLALAVKPQPFHSRTFAKAPARLSQ